MEDLLSKLHEEGHLEAIAVEKVRSALASGVPPDDALRTAADLPENKLLQILAAELELDYVELENNLPSLEFLKNFPARILLERKILPLRETSGLILVATSRVFDQTGLDELRVYLNQEVKPVLAPGTQIERALKKLLGVGADTVQSLISDAEEMPITVLTDETENGLDLSVAAEDASIIRFVNQVLKEAIELRATDVHFEPFENELRVRYRIDGVLQAAAIPAEIR
ncbi:MAG TPA: type II/IV secretion system protein, partial [bacterium]|nr:type II/IV secretion system protein [bacterium]